jgi:sec-independent protein translocase protein TatB
MFDVGFWELILIAIVALLVVGPERLPKLAYDVGLWFGRLQRYVRNARFQIENELHNYEIKNSLQKPTQLLEEIRSEIDETARDPWLSPYFTGELPPPENPGITADNAKQNTQSAAAAEGAAETAPDETGSSPEDGPAKPGN